LTARRAAALAGLGLVLRLLGLPLWGTFDTDEWKAWSSFAATQGLARVYGPPDRRILKLAAEASPEAPLAGLLRVRWPRRNFEWQGVGRAVDYPPGSMIVLWLEAKLYEAIDPALPSDRRFNAVINLAPLLGSLAILVLLWRSAAPSPGRVRGLAFWLNPAVLLAAPVLGYQDPVFGALAMGAVLALVAAASLVKPQGALLLPALATLVLRECGWRTWVRCALAGLGVGVLVFLPWWSQGYLLSALDGAFRPLGESDLSPLGLNLWWIAGYVMRWAQAGPWPEAAIVTAGAFRDWAGFDPGRLAGVLLLAGTAAVVALLVRLPRHPERSEGSPPPRRWLIPLAVILQVHVYAFCALAVHENHTLLGVLLAPLLIEAWPRAKALVAATSALAFVNLLLALRFGEGITTREWFLGLPALPLWDALFVVAALGHGVLLAALVRWSLSAAQDAPR
jgi:hypothetical protein